MVAASISLRSQSRGWLRGWTFDSVYILGTASVALACGSLVISSPNLFLPMFILNGWLLGYHHVVSTYTRLTFDREGFQQHKFLILFLPLIVLACVIALCAMFGAWILATTYLYWQWWHYTRQSYGVARIYARKASLMYDRLTTWMIYSVPLTGILYRSYQAPREFLFTEIRVLPVPFWLVVAAGALSAGLVGLWLAQQLRLWWQGELAVAHTAYIISHLTCFTAGYILIRDINFGWLVMNVWHNSQYILTVWMFNNNRFRETTSKPALLSYLSQRRNISLYFGFSLLVSTIFYGALSYSLSLVQTSYAAAAALPLFAVFYQAINFHHYIVDAVIWKVRKKSLRQNFGIVT